MCRWGHCLAASTGFGKLCTLDVAESVIMCCQLGGGRRRDINYVHQSIVHVQNAGMLACDTTGLVTSLQSPIPVTSVRLQHLIFLL